MLLSGEQIKSQGLIRHETASAYRGATYDLTVGTIISPKGEPVDQYEIPPQGLVKVVSAEIVKLPPNLVGYVLVKTSLCNEGILALNIGVVDPRYEGPLSSTLINFGSRKHRLRRGDVFSRLTIHDLGDNGVSIAKSEQVSTKDAIRAATDQVDRFLPATFLDIETTANEAAKKVFSDYQAALIKWLPAAALFIAALTFALNFGNMWVLYRYLSPQESLRASEWREDLDRQIRSLRAVNTELQKKIEQLHAETQKPRKSK
jgi:dUTPase